MKKWNLLQINTAKKKFRYRFHLKILILLLFSVFMPYCSLASVMIFELYADSRRPGAIYSDDYIVLYNSGPGSQSINGWSVQFAPSGTDTWAKFDLPNFTMPANTYFLIRIPVLGTNQPNTAPIPSPDFTSPLFRFNGIDNSGKLVLLNSNTLIPGGIFDPNGLPNLVDFVGYGSVDFSEQNNGPAPSPAPNGPIWRYLGNDTNNNGTDFQFEPEPLNGAFPVNLISFKANQYENTVLLMWETSNEQNNLGFDLEKSSDALHFEYIGFIESKKENNDLIKYEYNDVLPFVGINYYRLKQIDLDGKFSYSKIIAVDIKNGHNVLVFPNPAKDKLFLDFEFAKKIEEAFFIDINGKSKKLNIDSANNQIDISESNSDSLIVWFKLIGGKIKTMKIKRTN